MSGTIFAEDIRMIKKITVLLFISSIAFSKDKIIPLKNYSALAVEYSGRVGVDVSPAQVSPDGNYFVKLPRFDTYTGAKNLPITNFKVEDLQKIINDKQAELNALNKLLSDCR